MPLFKLIKHKIVVFDEVYIFYFILILYLNKRICLVLRLPLCELGKVAFITLYCCKIRLGGECGRGKGLVNFG